MKWIRNMILISASVLVLVILKSGCETPISEIVPFSGYWKITLSNSNGTELAVSTIIIQDTGAFCGNFTVNGSNDKFYIQGDVSGNGDVTGGFSNNCTGTVTGSFKGNFTELMGAGYASGSFSDTLQNANYKGTWEARRN